MSYQVLARKYRPKIFSQVVGQQHVLNILIYALDKNCLHHAYLFTGTRGVGKTSLARLLAKSISCVNGISSRPCCICNHCIAVEKGHFIDLIEVDAASRTKVEDTRDILENVHYMPNQGRYKIYIIDEVHMLSQHSFNALLKTLEEPPSHVIFLLATTDFQKLPNTIISRCLKCDLRHLSNIQIEQKLIEILELESVSFEQSALKIIAHTAEGSMRDALSLSDQSIAYGNGTILKSDVQNMLGIIDKDTIDKISLAILNEDARSIILLSEEAILSGKSPASILDAVAEVFYFATLFSFGEENTLTDTPCSISIIKMISQYYTKDVLQLYYQLTIKAREDVYLAPSSKCGLGMALLRLCAFSLDPDSRSQNLPQSKLEIKDRKNQNSILNATSDLSNMNPLTTKINNSILVKLKKSEKIHCTNQLEDNITEKLDVPFQGGMKLCFNTAHKKLKKLQNDNIETSYKCSSQEKKENTKISDCSFKQVSFEIKKAENLQKNYITENETSDAIDWQYLSRNLGLKGSALQIVLNSTLVRHTENSYVLHPYNSVQSLITNNSIIKISEALTKYQKKEIKISFIDVSKGFKKSTPEIKLRTLEAKQSSKSKGEQIFLKKDNLLVQDNKSKPSFPLKRSDIVLGTKSYNNIKVNSLIIKNEQKSLNELDKIYSELELHPNIQQLKQMGFQLTKDNIKLKKH